MSAKTHAKPLLIAFMSLGCAKNLVDSERMLAQLAQAGYIVGAPEEQAEVIVINTCGFLAQACEESYQAIRQALARKKTGPCRKVVVAGCLPVRYQRRLLEDLPGIDALVGVNNREDLIAVVNSQVDGKSQMLLDCKASVPVLDTPRVRLTPKSYAYLRISEGCSQGCSFCTIPAIRGPFRSKQPEMILAEARELLSDGAVELDIIGQDTTSYGKDLPTKTGLDRLLRSLDKLPGLRWLRMLYAYPSSLTEATIQAMTELPHVVHYLDLPLQHISDPILRRMRRGFSRARTERLIERLFQAMPDLALRTTMIVGFPGESDTDFTELLDFIKTIRFHALGAFAFSAEEGTAAAKLPKQIPKKIKAQRLKDLMLCQQRIVAQRNQALVGKEIDVLVDRVVNSKSAQGRSYAQAPEVDGICRIQTSNRLSEGQIITTKVVGFDGYDIKVRPLTKKL